MPEAYSNYKKALKFFSAFFVCFYLNRLPTATEFVLFNTGLAYCVSAPVRIVAIMPRQCYNIPVSLKAGNFNARAQCKQNAVGGLK